MHSLFSPKWEGGSLDGWVGRIPLVGEVGREVRVGGEVGEGGVVLNEQLLGS